MKFKAKFFCGIFICLMTTAWLHGESKDSLVVKMNLKGYFPSDQEDNEKVFLAQPMALARNAKGNIYVYDYKWNTISIFDSEGKFISKTGKRGQGPGEFQSVRRVLPDGENIIILDSMKHEICHLDSKGKYLKSFKTFKSYNDFAIDHNGRIYCAPLASSVNPFLVDVLDESGNLLYSFGTPIRKFEKFSDSFLNNTKIVCDGKSITILFITIALVQQYDLNGKLVRECTFKELPDIKNKEEKMNLNQIKNRLNCSGSTAKAVMETLRILGIVNLVESDGQKWIELKPEYLILTHTMSESVPGQKLTVCEGVD